MGALFVFGGVMKKVDKLGRIVIPRELREKYGLTEGAIIEFLDNGEGITVKVLEPICKMCRNKISDGAVFPLCDACIAKITKDYNKQ